MHRLVAIAAVLVGLTVLRPWDALPPAGPEPRPVAAPILPVATGAIATATPSAPPSLLPDQASCSPAGWQLVTLDHLGDWTVRGWVPAGATLAGGPLDPEIRPTTLDSPAVIALGVCTPPVTDGAAPLAGGPSQVVAAWRIDTGEAVPVPVVASADQGARSGVAFLYRAAAADGRILDAWPVGRYVLGVGPSDAAAIDRGSGWFVGVIVRAR
jgi:hypothetical protein